MVMCHLSTQRMGTEDSEFGWGSRDWEEDKHGHRDVVWAGRKRPVRGSPSQVLPVPCLKRSRMYHTEEGFLFFLKFLNFFIPLNLPKSRGSQKNSAARNPFPGTFKTREMDSYHQIQEFKKSALAPRQEITGTDIVAKLS